MNERSIIEPPPPGGRDLWVDQYLPSQAVEPVRPGVKIDIAWIRGAIFRQRWLILGCVAAALICGLVVTLLTPPTYEASSTVRVFPFAATIVEGQDVASPVVSPNQIDDFMLTQLEIIKSRSLAEVVARNMSLERRSALLGPDVDERRPPNLTDKQWEESKVKRAAGILQSDVTAEIPSKSQIITIKVQSGDPVLAAEIANAYSAAFVQSEVRRSVDSNSYAREYLLEQIEQIRTRLGDAERSANSYAREAGIVTQQTTTDDGTTTSTITGSNLTEINSSFIAARAARIAAEQKWRAIANIPAAEVPEVLNNPVMQQLNSERARQNAELTVLRQRYNDDFPAIAELRARINLIDQQLARAGQDIKASARSEYLIARQQEAALERELGSITNEALVEQDKKIEFTGLEREATALQEQLKGLLDRYNEISTASNAQSGTITPLDSATVPSNPVAPSLSKNFIIAFVLGIALAGGLGLVREIFVDQFRRPDDIEERLGIAFLGSTPHVKAEDLESEENNNFSSLMEAYASIRSTVDFAVSRHSAVIQLTSSQASEGKSTTSLILAQLFARMGRDTLLIDADLRKPSINGLLDIERPKAGLAEVLLGHVSFDEAKIENIRENLTVLAVSGIPHDPVELVSSERFREFIEARRREYSLVIIDSSPLLGLADAAEIARCVDATIFVIEANRTTLAQARASVNRLRAVGAKLMGSVLTKYRALEAGSDYAYQYQYYQYGDKK